MKLVKHSVEAEILEDMKDPELAAFYLMDNLENGNDEDFQRALRRVASVHPGGLKAITGAAGVSRESLYAAKTSRFPTVKRMLDAMGFEIEIRPKKIEAA